MYWDWAWDCAGDWEEKGTNRLKWMEIVRCTSNLNIFLYFQFEHKFNLIFQFYENDIQFFLPLFLLPSTLCLLLLLRLVLRNPPPSIYTYGYGRQHLKCTYEYSLLLLVN